MMTMIGDFSAEYHFLSNFSYEGGVKPTVEHHYQAWKATFPKEASEVMAAHSPGAAKRLGQKLVLRPDWEDIKLQVMLDLLMAKFAEVEIQDKLLATGEATLVEGNTWGDTYWGVCKNEGENWLGQLLEVVRDVYSDR